MHAGELSIQPMSSFRPSVLEYPNVYIQPPPRINLQAGENATLPEHKVAAQVGMPASAWEGRRNYRPTPAIEAGEAEV